MYCCVALRTASVLALVTLSGCGLNFLGEERESWRDATERACFAQKLVVPSYFQRPAKEVEGKGTCGIEKPLKVNAFAQGIVAVTGGDVLLGCMMTRQMERWVREGVQPAAQARFGMPVTEVLTMGTYACRTRNNNSRRTKMSEHAYANAFDIAGFRLADGRTIRVKGDWRKGDPATQAFLRETLISACTHFTTVLGPGSNRQHEDHIHIDLARHGKSGGSHYCRPKLDRPAPTPLDPYAGMPMAGMTQPAPAMVPASPQAPDYERPSAPTHYGWIEGPRPAEPVAPSGPYTPPASIPLSYAP
jgi:hypothetical protein